MSRAVTTSPPRLRLLAVLVGAAVALVLAGQASAQPAKPIVRVNATTATSITIGWRAVRGAARYRVARNGSVVATTTARSATVNGILCGRRYTIAVRAVGPQGGLSRPALRSIRKGTGCQPRSRIVRTNAGFSCTRALSVIARNNGINGNPGRLPLLVKINFTTYRAINPGTVEITARVPRRREQRHDRPDPRDRRRRAHEGRDHRRDQGQGEPARHPDHRLRELRAGRSRPGRQAGHRRRRAPGRRPDPGRKPHRVHRLHVGRLGGGAVPRARVPPGPSSREA